ncbi:ATP-grasp fold amidoligase family protein [Helicobacter himalayensis]|uniref:ATP-grasp fold amidoligase family protein n=1 Tax=Helicobacter himalayensis TaxID=1591088 RepID=UPI003D6F21E8
MPESFVLKTNHDCGGVVLVPNKQDFLANKKQFQKAMKKLRAHLKTNYYDVCREWHYKDIEPRIFAEELLQNGSAETKEEYKALEDYKVHVFGNGEEVAMDMEIGRFTNHKTAMLTESWEKLPFELGNPAPQSTPPKPQNADSMFEVAKEIGKDFDAIRVDMYNANMGGIAIIGELTFTPAGGTAKVTPSEWDEKFAKTWRVRKM